MMSTRLSTILLHTARQEPLSRVLLEAMSVGTAVVATRVGGTPEAVGDAGILTPPGDIEAMAQALSVLLNDPGNRRTLETALLYPFVEIPGCQLEGRGRAAASWAAWSASTSDAGTPKYERAAASAPQISGPNWATLR